MLRTKSERIRELLHYDPATGVITWRPGKPRFKRVHVAGTRVDSEGCIGIKIDGVRYRAHRLAFKWVTGRDPSHEIDHRNLDPSDNRWENIREATPSQNKANRRTDCRSLTGLKGVCRRVNHKGEPTGEFISYVTIPNAKGRVKYLGRFATAEEAHAAWFRAAREAYGEFARR